jgi:hypothetical protein
MPTYKFINPTKIIDGATVHVGINEWAQQTLSESDLQAYLASVLRQDTIFASVGSNLVIEGIVDAGNVEIGNQATTSDPALIPMDAEYQKFQNQFQADPALTFPPNWGDPV